MKKNQTFFIILGISLAFLLFSNQGLNNTFSISNLGDNSLNIVTSEGTNIKITTDSNKIGTSSLKPFVITPQNSIMKQGETKR